MWLLFQQSFPQLYEECFRIALRISLSQPVLSEHSGS